MNGAGVVESVQVASRFAAAAQEAGALAVVVCGRDGKVIACSGESDGTREAALAGFLASRAEALIEDGDLRGMGRAVANSRLEEMSFSGSGGDTTLLSLPGCYVFASFRAGNAGAAASSLRTLARRFF